ncbi:MAG: hypothetical protein EXQ48_02100 [Acidobacteria bacterium]|nr:hypothetical protein [Acidobacteriota bacterium]
MVNRLGCVVLVVCAVSLGSVGPAAAQQTLNLSFGHFAVTGEDARVDRDILVTNRNAFVFDIKDFSAATVGGEWLVPLGNYVEAGAGASFSRRTVHSVYEALVNADGSEIEQDFILRLVPVAFTVRVLPLGQSNGVQPYIGGGLGIINWRYSESGEFVDERCSAGRSCSIFRDSFVASGSQTGPLALAGIRFAGDSLSAGGEVRFQKADASLGSRFAGLTDPRIDLGGWAYQFTVGMRFGR